MHANLIKAAVATTIVAASVFAGSASAAQILTNGNFETGTIAGWTGTSTQSSSFTASFEDGQNSQVVKGGGTGGSVYYVRNKSSSYFGTAATPISGYSVFNGFDGDAGIFTLKQGFTIGDNVTSAILNFAFAAQSSYSSSVRLLDVNLLAANGTTVVANLYDYILPYNQTAWTVNNLTLDITSKFKQLGAGSYFLAFQQTIPQSYTGPAVFALDNVALNVNVPEPTSVALLGLGLAGLAVARRRRA